MSIIDWALTSPSICLQILYYRFKFLTCNISLITARILTKQKRENQCNNFFPRCIEFLSRLTDYCEKNGTCLRKKTYKNHFKTKRHSDVFLLTCTYMMSHHYV